VKWALVVLSCYLHDFVVGTSVNGLNVVIWAAGYLVELVRAQVVVEGWVVWDVMLVVMFS